MKISIWHRMIRGLKDFLAGIDEELDRKAKLKEPLTLPSTMTAEEALDFLYHRYFGDECVMDTGPAIQAYPIMVRKICWYIDNN